MTSQGRHHDLGPNSYDLYKPYNYSLATELVSLEFI